MLSASNRQIMSCRSGMSLASLVYLATSVILFSASTVQSCDVSTTVCLVNGSISFPPASGTPSNVLVDTEPDFGLAMSIYLEEIVKGFFKFVFPAGLPWGKLKLNYFLDNVYPGEARDIYFNSPPPPPPG